MKALQEGDRGRREALFYRRIFVEDPRDDKDAVMFLRDFVPKFHGVVQVRQTPRRAIKLLDAQDKMGPYLFGNLWSLFLCLGSGLVVNLSLWEKVNCFMYKLDLLFSSREVMTHTRCSKI